MSDKLKTFTILKKVHNFSLMYGMEHINVRSTYDVWLGPGVEQAVQIHQAVGLPTTHRQQHLRQRPGGPPAHSSVADPDPGPGILCPFDPWIRDPGWVKSQDPDLGCTTRIPFPRA